MKKIARLLLLPLIVLTSCGDKEIAGRYSFQLGKSSGSHVGIYADLTNEHVEIASRDDAKKFIFTIDIDQPTNKNLLSTNEDESFLEGLIGGKLTGYWYATPHPYGSRINIGTEDINELLDGIFNFPKPFSEEIIEKIVCAFVAKSTLTIHIPVSMESLQMQLAWYGYYFDTDTFDVIDFYDKLPQGAELPGNPGTRKEEERENRVGTVPTNDQMNEMKFLISTYLSEWVPITFRMPHVVKLGLLHE